MLLSINRGAGVTTFCPRSSVEGRRPTQGILECSDEVPYIPRTPVPLSPPPLVKGEASLGHHAVCTTATSFFRGIPIPLMDRSVSVDQPVVLALAYAGGGGRDGGGNSHRAAAVLR